ncbi:circadian clock-controlled protein daywake-like [Pectinophora gossypiella]|uniref:circadian clock-controlled protein daywake-like n=1 Tax=Pectinophora gossypiella TaxID=13191 RepID=UPI00214DF95C|nr:circadian clock-controlled protein daywake-like [Pectinophora gossypiella]
MLSAIAVIFALISVSNGIKEGYLPSYINPCDLAKPSTEFVDCVKEQIEATLPHFTKGIEELGVPSLDPVALDDIHIDGNGLKLTFTHAAMHGLSDSKLSQLKLDIGKDVETFSLSFKGNMSVSAKYVVDGRILILPIQGKGDAKVNCHNIEVQIDSKLTHVKDAKGIHFKLVTPSYKYNIQSTKFEFQNLFNGNKQLSDATHQFANENWKQLMDDLSPPVIKQIVKTCVKAINKFFSNVTIPQIVKGYNN